MNNDQCTEHSWYLISFYFSVLIVDTNAVKLPGEAKLNNLDDPLECVNRLTRVTSRTLEPFRLRRVRGQQFTASQ
jgi:hypothetical protein